MSSFEKIPTGIFNKVENNKEIFVKEFKDKLQEFFPSAVKDGIVDFEALLNEFGKYAETDEKEKYNMTWVGKKEAIKTANEDIIGKTLKYVPEDSKNPETTENLYIEGDNLEVLKLLRNSYYGKIKMIYIDPPYNTGNEFIYNDNFKMDREEYEKLEGSIDEYNERLTINTQSNGSYHSNWLNMLYPRIKISKDLLSDDGFFCVSIDEYENCNVKKICDEIYGEANFIGEMPRKTKSSTNDPNNNFNNQHDYILIYKKGLQATMRGIEKDLSNYKNPDNDINGEWKSSDPSAKSGGDGTYFEIINPYTKKVDLPPKGRFWAFNKNTFSNYLKCGKIKFKEKHRDDERGFIFKTYKNQLKSKFKPVDSLELIDNTYMNQNATKYLNSIGINFDYSKPVELMECILDLAINNEGIILDFFSGSSTIAEAILRLNYNDNGNRKFIMVQLPELCNEKSEAYKNGYKTICEIGKERIRRAGEKIKEENKDKEGIENLDIGFKVFRVSDTNIRWISDAIKRNDGIEEKEIITQEEMRNNESYKDRLDFNPWFTDLDVVYEMMLKRQDIELTEKIEKLSYIGDRTYLVGYTILVCLEENITEEMIRKISEIETSLSWIVFRDSAFDDDINLKTNTINLLRTLIKEKNPRNKNQKILWI